MTYEEARRIAQAVFQSLTFAECSRLKSVDVIPRLHRGMLTIRIYFVNQVADDPEPFIFKKEELLNETP